MSILSRCRIPPAHRPGINFRRAKSCSKKRCAKSRVTRPLRISHKGRSGHDGKERMCSFASLLDFVRVFAVHIPTRAEIPEFDKWDLTHLFVDVTKWQEDFAW